MVTAQRVPVETPHIERGAHKTRDACGSGSCDLTIKQLLGLSLTNRFSPLFQKKDIALRNLTHQIVFDLPALFFPIRTLKPPQLRRVIDSMLRYPKMFTVSSCIGWFYLVAVADLQIAYTVA